MVRIIDGGFFSSLDTQILEYIKESVAHGRRAMLIVPEQQTLSKESLYARQIPSEYATVFEVTNFTRLSDSVFRALGGVAGKYADAAQRSLIMWRTLSEVLPKISFISSEGQINRGVVESAVLAVSEMDRLAINADMLLELAPTVTDNARLYGKVCDLSVILGTYKRLLCERYRDASEALIATTQKLKENPDYLSDCDIYVSGFTSLTESQYSLVRLLAERADLTFALNMPHHAKSVGAEFGEIRKFRRRLIDIMQRTGCEVQLLHASEGQSIDNPLAEVSSLLWQSTGALQQPCDSVRIFEARSPYEMCEALSADIMHRVVECGARFCDVAIVARDVTRYEGILDVALERAGVSYFMSRSQDITSFEPIRLIYSALFVVAGGFMRDDVITYMKCGIDGISRDCCDEFELYTERWQIDGSRFYDSNVWNMNPDGLKAGVTDEQRQTLVRINDTRSRLITPLTELHSDIGEGGSVRDITESLVSFLIRIGVPQRIMRRADELYAIGRTAQAEMYTRLWQSICDSFDRLVEVLGELRVDVYTYQRQLDILFSSTSLSHIPTFVDTVTVGSANMLRLDGKKHIYLIGVNEGEFPASVSDNAYFSDSERAALDRAGMPSGADLAQRSSTELYYFSRAFSFARESVTLYYCAQDTRFKAQKPSQAVSSIIRMSEGRITPRRLDNSDAFDKIYSTQSALYQLSYLDKNSRRAVSEVLSERGYSQRLERACSEIDNGAMRLSADICNAVFPQRMHLTQSQMDKYINCPLSYFCQYTLRLEDNDRAEFDARNIGTFIHAILENFFAYIAKGSISVTDLTQGEREELVRKYAKQYVDGVFADGNVCDRRTELLIERLTRLTVPVVDGLCDEFSSSQFLPQYFELRINERDPKLPSPIILEDDDGQICVTGIVDRVDTYRDADGDVYVRVVDYKTGSKDFKPKNLAYGENLQMFLYLRAIVDTKKPDFLYDIGADGGELIPAGVIYVKTAISDVVIDRMDTALAKSAIKAAQAREGMVLDDAVSLGAMNSAYLPLRLVKSGAIHGSDVHKSYSREGWKDICRTVEEAVLKIGRNIRRGYINAMPREISSNKTACDYCQYKAICRKVKT